MRKKEIVYIKVKVQPRSSKPGVEEISPEEFKVRVQAPPAQGEANKEILKRLSDHFDLPSSRIVILRGHKSRQKLVSVDFSKS